ncbi:PAS domain-containing protein [Loktanella sp. DJP18]|uniref:PAS domain-containing protein n=1 Tax=Loktanella sp. DJP18 TaxID=3409788 RepID=UPI003BB6F128
MPQLNMVEVAHRLDTSNTAISIADAQQPDMPLCYVNPAFNQITGYAADEVLGRNCRFLQSDLDNEDARAQMRKALARGASAQIVFRNCRADGSAFNNLVIIEPLKDRDDRLVYVVGAQFVIDRETRPEKAQDTGRSIVAEIDKLLDLNERLRATSRQALARSMAATVKLWLDR